MLRHVRLWLAVAAILQPQRAVAQDEVDGVRRPERLTIGTADQFLGQLSPDGETLYYASNRNTTVEIFAQESNNGSGRLLFDDNADVSWPRVSPDGKQLLYVSLRQDAVGQLCVRTLPTKRSAIGPRRCLADSSGALQAQWLSPTTILLLSRPVAQGDMRLSFVDVGRHLSRRTLFDRNLTAPTVTPDGRWLVYTPVERYVERIGPGFAARAGKTLMAQRLDRPTDKPQPIELDVTGHTGQAAFAVDGRALYFVQFVSDTNQDGVVDNSDHGVLFRVPFAPERDDAPAALSGMAPLQLTDASWNCQYPSPSAQRLLATCATRSGHLDLYQLPQTGVVPAEWTEARIRQELELSTSPSEQLLLHARLLAIVTDAATRRSELVTLIRLHLSLDQFDAAERYAAKVAAQRDKSTAGLGTAMRLLVAHRKALRARERGRLSLDFTEDSRARLDELAASKATSAAGVAMRHVLRSEIADVLGDKDLARAELEQVVLDEVTLPAILELYGDRADALYRQLDDRHALLAALTRLAAHPALPATDRVGYARAAARTAARGLPHASANAALVALRDGAPAGSDLQFAAELALAVAAIEPEEASPATVARLLSLYRRESRPERKRAVMMDAVQRGAERGDEKLIAELAALYVDDAPKGTVERRRAQRLYRRLLEDRAYADLRAGRKDQARDTFLAVAKRTGSLESWTGYLDRRLSEEAPADVLEKEIVAGAGTADADKAPSRYARAYLLARRLPKLKGEAAEAAVKEGLQLLRGGWNELRDQPEAVATMGALHHERFLHTGDRAAAVRASGRYLVALDLSRRNHRYRAMLLEQMAQLQAQVGNWRMALDYFEQREKLPIVDGSVGLAHQLGKARTLLHLDREADAARVADAALGVIERSPRMEKYLPMCLDRAALYNLAADQFARAVQLYERLAPIVAKAEGEGSVRNRVVLPLARAAAALGNQRPAEALMALAEVEPRLAQPGMGAILKWPHATEEHVLWSYRQIAAGLRAKAHLQLGQHGEAARALEERRRLYDSRAVGMTVDEHTRARALVEAQLGELAIAAGQRELGLADVRRALERVESVAKSEGKQIDRDQLTLLWLAAEARLAAPGKSGLKLRSRLTSALDVLGKQTDPKWRAITRWLEIHLGLLGPPRPPRATPTAKPG